MLSKEKESRGRGFGIWSETVRLKEKSKSPIMTTSLLTENENLV